jgi:hypothetical protein
VLKSGEDFAALGVHEGFSSSVGSPTFDGRTFLMLGNRYTKVVIRSNSQCVIARGQYP